MAEGFTLRRLHDRLRFEWIADSNGDVYRQLEEPIVGRFVRYEGQCSGSTWNVYLLGDGNHDVLEGCTTALAADTPVDGHLTQALGGSSGTAQHLPLIIVLNSDMLFWFSGGANAEGYLELFE